MKKSRDKKKGLMEMLQGMETKVVNQREQQYTERKEAAEREAKAKAS